MGSSFSSQAQKNLILAKLIPGSFIHIFCKVTTPPKPKFLVVVHVDSSENLVLCFLLNSEIHPFIRSKPELFNSQVLLSKANYSFLDGDSYLDCSKVQDEIDLDDIVDHLLRIPKDYKGILEEDDIEEIVITVNNSSTISEYDKELIINSLGN